MKKKMSVYTALAGLAVAGGAILLARAFRRRRDQLSEQAEATIHPTHPVNTGWSRWGKRPYSNAANGSVGVASRHHQ